MYRARVEGIPKPAEGTLRHWLETDRTHKKALAFDAPRPTAKEAVLNYRSIGTHNGQTLLEIQLLTGRFHQIRAQLAAIGHPIAGDSKYGATLQFEGPGIALQAFELQFKDPLTGEAICIQLPQPESF